MVRRKLGKFWHTLGRRFAEPSTYASVAMLLGMFGIVDAQQAAVINEAGSALGQAAQGHAVYMNFGTIGGALSALIGVFVRETGGN